MGVIWHKVWFDLWHNKTRTLLTVLSIAIGVFAMGAIFGMSDMMSSEMDRSHRSVIPPHITVYLTEQVKPEVIEALRDIPGVEDVVPYNEISILYKIHPARRLARPPRRPADRLPLLLAYRGSRHARRGRAARRAHLRNPGLPGKRIRRDLVTAQCRTDEDWREFCRNGGGTNYHPVGSCRMGPDPATSVVDARLRVHGLRGLRIVDSSIMPKIPGGNTTAPTVMIGEKGADVIRGDWGGVG